MKFSSLAILSAFASITDASYILQSSKWNEGNSQLTANLRYDEISSVSSSSEYGQAIKDLTLNVECYEYGVRVKITDSAKDRWEIPNSISDDGTLAGNNNLVDIDSSTYNVETNSNPFSFSVSRKSDGKKLFDSSGEDFVYSDQYLKLTTNHLSPTTSVFGVGETTRTSNEQYNGVLVPGSTTSLWARDMAAATFDTNLYGSHPFLLSIDAVDQKASGLYLRNSNAMDVSYSSDKTGISYSVTGGIIDLFVFAGDSPKLTIQQYQSVIGKPILQPYWSLGFHQCRYGYNNLGEVKDVVSNYIISKIPLDIAWLDIDYMGEWLDFTYDDTLFPADEVKDWVDDLHDNKDMKFVPIVDPGILAVDPSWDMEYEAFTDGIEMDIFVKDMTGNYPYLGQVWPGPTHYPDWFHPNITTYWTKQLKGWHDKAEFDGLWIDMNEASNFCTGQVCQNKDPLACPTHELETQTTCCLVCHDVEPDNMYDYPPYAIGNDHGIGDISPLNTKTITPSALHYGDNLEYNVHNLHGLMEGITTNDALVDITGGKRPFILSRSTFPGHGTHAAHWTGDNAATWNDLKASIATINTFGLFGVNMIGADICGFIGDSWEELCARWIEVGAFHTFSRNHNTIGAEPQELYRWESVTEASRNVLGMRYKLLPYFYTIMADGNMNGDTASRFLWINFPEDVNTYELATGQFMVGDYLMVSPVLEEGKTEVSAYFPKGNWWNIFTLDKVLSDKGEFKTLDAPLTEVNAHIFGGGIIPLQGEDNNSLTTVENRKLDFSLFVALDSSGVAEGHIYLDDGGEDVTATEKTITQFNVKGSSLTSKVVANTFETKDVFSKITVLGVSEVSSIKSVIATNWSADCKELCEVELKFEVNKESLVMHTQLSVSGEWKINWN